MCSGSPSEAGVGYCVNKCQNNNHDNETIIFTEACKPFLPKAMSDNKGC